MKMMTVEELEKYCREYCEFLTKDDGQERDEQLEAVNRMYLLGRITGMYRLWEKIYCPEGFGDKDFYDSFDRMRNEFCGVEF